MYDHKLTYLGQNTELNALFMVSIFFVLMFAFLYQNLDLFVKPETSAYQ